MRAQVRLGLQFVAELGLPVEGRILATARQERASVYFQFQIAVEHVFFAEVQCPVAAVSRLGVELRSLAAARPLSVHRDELLPLCRIRQQSFGLDVAKGPSWGRDVDVDTAGCTW